VGLFDRLGLTTNRFEELSSTVDLRIASPWRDDEGTLGQILLEDLLGAELADALPMSRGTAITIPAVSKARNLLVSTIAKFPLVALDEKGRLATQPTFLYRSNTSVSPYERMAWTIDDLIFHGVSLWATERGAADGENGRRPILDAQWVPPTDWTIENGELKINHKAVEDDDFILINSPFEGLLNVANRTLRGARDTELAWTARMRNPIYITEMVIDDDSELDPDEVKIVEKAWLKKTQAGKPSFGLSPKGTHLETHGDENADGALFIENRNAVRTDVGSFLNVRASMLDGTAGIDSLTYSTTEGERNSFYEFDLPFWVDPIQEALSLDKVVPRGTRIRFDKYELYAATPNPTGAPTED
jgi:hypothetical protein